MNKTRTIRFILIAVIFWGCAKGNSQVTFNKTLAFSYLEKQCSFGPRAPGLPGHTSCLAFLLSELKSFSDNVKAQQFFHSNRRHNKTLQLTNIIASFNGRETSRKPILLCAHWDTRPMADRDPQSENRTKPILGANDGASGVAVLLEIARCLCERPAPQPVTIVFFDGEDGGREGDFQESWCLGSQHFAGTLKGSEFEYAILLDMIGDKDLQIPMEGQSVLVARDIVTMVWERARRLGIDAFEMNAGQSVYDDHWPLIQAGIRAIDIIDFDYPYWHTIGDTPDKCSPESLQAVGDVLLDIIYNP